jgi:predicted pyridoxine 5'-phosphate oxidase superfamily flavin-nucleotide-binding protein
MAENSRQVQTSNPFDRFDEAINDPGLYPTYQYERPESRQLEPLAQDRVPLFLSDYDQQYQDDRFEDEARQYTFGSKRQRSHTSRIVTGVVAATAVAAIVGLFSIDATRSVFVNAKASLASLAPASLGGGQGEAAPPPAPPPQRVAAVAAPEPRIAAPEAQAVYRSRPAEAAAAAPAVAAAPATGKPAEMAYNSQPSREDIQAAYQSAMKGGQVAAVAPVAPPPQPAAPAARRMDPDELAGLLKRARSLLAVGDIPAARLLLERAADAQEAEAALMLGTTYDPLVIGNQDMRSIAPDPAMARQWYQKAAALGSADARRRLSQIQN